MHQKEPNWEGSTLRPTGKLTFKEPPEIIQDRGMVVVKALAVDEIGTVWNVGHTIFGFDMSHPKEWPVDIRATYVIKVKTRHSESVYRVQANSYNEACMNMHAKYPYYTVANMALDELIAPNGPIGTITPGRW